MEEYYEDDDVRSIGTYPSEDLKRVGYGVVERALNAAHPNTYYYQPVSSDKTRILAGMETYFPSEDGKEPNVGYIFDELHGIISDVLYD